MRETPHPVMFISLLQRGSMVIDVSGNRMDVKFLRETGAIDDHFTIIKGEPAEPLRIATVRLRNGEVRVAWKSKAGERYQIEQADEVQDGVWEAASPEITATGATSFWSGTAEPDGRVFYRVVNIQ
jgi:hypothetical protein